LPLNYYDNNETQKKYEELPNEVKWQFEKIVDKNRTTSQSIVYGKLGPAFLKANWSTTCLYDKSTGEYKAYIKFVIDKDTNLNSNVVYDEITLNNKKKKIKCFYQIGFMLIIFKKVDDRRTIVSYNWGIILNFIFSWKCF
jgi:hypothetical protein